MNNRYYSMAEVFINMSERISEQTARRSSQDEEDALKQHKKKQMFKAMRKAVRKQRGQEPREENGRLYCKECGARVMKHKAYCATCGQRQKHKEPEKPFYYFGGNR